MRNKTARHTGYADPRLILIAFSVWLVTPTSEAQIGPKHASTPTHQTLMDYAATKAGSLSPPLTFNSTQNTKMQEGARDEDILPRWLWHAYNPVNTSGFIIDGIYYNTAHTESAARWSSMATAFASGNLDGGDGSGAWHYLGRVSHLLQDMSAPLHVFAESHPAVSVYDSTYGWPCKFEAYWEANDSTLKSPILAGIGMPLQSSTLDPMATEKLDSWTASRLQDHFNNSCPNKSNDDVRGYVEVLAWLTYFRTTFWGEVTMGSSTGNGVATTPSTTSTAFSDGTVNSQVNVLHTMFNGNTRWINSFIGDDYYEITDRNGYVFRFMSMTDIDDWAACGRPYPFGWSYGEQDSSIRVGGSDDDSDGVRVTGRFWFDTRELGKDTSGSYNRYCYPNYYPDGTSMTDHLHQYSGKYGYPLTVRYNAGLLGLANRRVTVKTADSTSANGFSWGRKDNFGNGLSFNVASAGSNFFFVAKSQVTLTAPSSNSGGQAFVRWLKDGSTFSGNTARAITINTTSATIPASGVIYTAEYESSSTAPSVRTDPVSDKTTTSASLNATITATGGSSIVDARFEWTSTTFPGTVIYSVPVSGNTFSHNLTGLQPNTTYTYHAYAKNSAGFWNSTVNNVVFTTDSSVQTVATPVISPNGGSFSDSVQITLACSTSGATIRYTTNGSDPTGSSTSYSGAFTLNSSATVKAKAFRSGYTDSGIASAGFTINSSGTPVIEVTGGGEVIPSGSTATSRFNNTDFDDRWIGEETTRYNFRIYNQGQGTLNLTGNPKVRIDGSSSFFVDEEPQASVAEGDYTFFKILFDPQSVGIHTATVRINSNDSDTPEYTYAIRGEGKFRDITAPSITITTPTSDVTWSTSSGTLNLGGQASDNVGVTQVTWSNDRGGAGAASGTTTWSANSVSLLSGVNVITVAARDATNNVGIDTLTVTYTPPTPEITVNPTSLGQIVQQGTNAASQTFTIRNSGSGTLNYTVAVVTGTNWLSVNPSSGSSTAEQDSITVNYTTTNLPVGTHNATISVSAAGANNSPVTVPVNLTVTILPINMPYEAKWAVAMNTFNVGASAIAQDGGVLLVGYFTGTITAGGQSLTANGSEEDAFAVKLDASGQVVWVRQYGGSNEEIIDSCTPHPGGGWVISGRFKGTGVFGSQTLTAEGTSGKSDAFLIRLDENGNVLWARRGGGPLVDYGWQSAVDGSGNCFLIGNFTTSATFSGGSTTLTAAGARFDIFIAKYSSNGDFQWAKSAGGSAYDTVGCAVADFAGNIYVGGTFETQAAFGPYTLTVQGNPVSYDAYLAKWNGNGDVMWAKRFGEPAGGNSGDYMNFVSLAADGSCYFGGSYDGPMDVDGQQLPDHDTIFAAFVGKLDSTGTLQWLRAAPATPTPGTFAIMTDSQHGIATPDGGLMIGGRYRGRLEFGTMAITNNTMEEHLYVAKFDASGNAKWGLSVGNHQSLHYLGRASGDHVRFMARFNQSVNLPGLETITVTPGDTLLVELGPPNLAVPTVSWTAGQGKIILEWPSTAVGFGLESSTSLLPNSWTPVLPAVIVGDKYKVTNTMSGGAKFYRLSK